MDSTLAPRTTTWASKTAYEGRTVACSRALDVHTPPSRVMCRTCPSHPPLLACWMPTPLLPLPTRRFRTTLAQCSRSHLVFSDQRSRLRLEAQALSRKPAHSHPGQHAHRRDCSQHLRPDPFRTETSSHGHPIPSAPVWATLISTIQPRPRPRSRARSALVRPQRGCAPKGCLPFVPGLCSSMLVDPMLLFRHGRLPMPLSSPHRKHLFGQHAPLRLLRPPPPWPNHRRRPRSKQRRWQPSAARANSAPHVPIRSQQHRQERLQAMCRIGAWCPSPPRRQRLP